MLVEDGEGIRVTPSSVASLARAVAVVRAHRVALRVRGSGDAPVNAPPSGVLLDLGSLDRIATVNAATGIARVEAGCSVAALESAVRRAGCTLGPLLPSVRAGSVGAWLAGPTRGARGIPGARRETAALSLAAVLPDGRIAEGPRRTRQGGARFRRGTSRRGRHALGKPAGLVAARGPAPVRAACGRIVRGALAPGSARRRGVRCAGARRGGSRDRAAPVARQRSGMGGGGGRGRMAAPGRSAGSRGVTALQRAQELCEYCPKMCRFACPVSEAARREALTPWAKVSLAALSAREPDAAAALAFAGCTGS